MADGLNTNARPRIKGSRKACRGMGFHGAVRSNAVVARSGITPLPLEPAQMNATYIMQLPDEATHRYRQTVTTAGNHVTIATGATK